MKREMTGAEMVVQALKDQGVDTVFGYPGGAVLPIYDAIFQQNDIRHILVRHEQAAAHAAEGYARSTGRPGVVLVTSGPGATNAVTGMTDALDGFDPDRRPDRPGPDLHDRQRRLPGGRHRRHHPPLHQAQLAGEGHRQARRDHPPGLPRRHPRPPRPGARRHPQGRPVRHRRLHPARGGARPALPAADPRRPRRRSSPPSRRWRRPSGRSSTPAAASSTPAARRAGSCASSPTTTGFPLTSTLMGLGAYPASGKALDRHARHARHLRGQLGDARLRRHALHRRPLRRPHHRPHRRLLARTPSRSTSTSTPPRSTRTSTSTCPIVGDVASVLADMLALWKERGSKTRSEAVGQVVEADRALARPELPRLPQLRQGHQAAVRPPAPRGADPRPRPLHQHRGRPAPDVGGAVPGLRGAPPLDDLAAASAPWATASPPRSACRSPTRTRSSSTSPARPRWLMNMQEMGTAVQYRLPVKQFILNNERLGMVRQWQELLHGERYSSSWSEALPDFVKLADAFGAKGILLTDPAKLDDAIIEMIEHPGPVIVDCVVEKHENCFPMIPSRQGPQRDAARRGRRPPAPSTPAARSWSDEAGDDDQAPPSSSTRRSSSTSRRASRGRGRSRRRGRRRAAPGSWSSPRPGCPATRPGSGGCGPARTWRSPPTCTRRSPRTPSTLGAGWPAPAAGHRPRPRRRARRRASTRSTRAPAAARIFNSAVVIDADGRIANHHRKLMPTNPERMVWGFGDGTTLRVVDTAVGAHRHAALLGELHAAGALRALRPAVGDLHRARPGIPATAGSRPCATSPARPGAWVIGCSTPIARRRRPRRPAAPRRLFPDPDEWINDGDAVVHRPFGPAVAGPMHREKRPALGRHRRPPPSPPPRRSFDAAGHYARPDVFTLAVNRTPQRPVVFTDPPTGGSRHERPRHQERRQPPQRLRPARPLPRAGGDPHPRRPRRQRGRRPRPRHRPLLRPRLQHREPDRGRDRPRGPPQPHHHRHHRHARR